MFRFPSENSLRYRVAVALTTFSVFIVGTLCIILYFVSDNIEEEHIEQVIEMEMDHLVQRYQKQSDSIYQVGLHLKSYVIHSIDAEMKVPTYLRGLNAGYHRIYYGLEDFHVLVRTDQGVKFLVAYRIALHQQRLSKLRVIILFSWFAVVAIAFVVGYLLAGVLVRQVTDLADRVSTLATEGNQTGLLLQPDMDEEVAQLAQALDDYQIRIKRMLQREQEFTANISHELRTPITTILTSCELLAASSDIPARAQHRIKMIESAATRMGEQLQALLFLAREQALGVTEPVAIAECVYDAVEPICTEIYRKGLDFEVNIAPAVTVVLNRQALHTALMNLLRNAVQYTESGFIRVDYDNRRLSVADSGIGIEPAYLPLLYERFFRGSTQGEGLGIGLAIVKRICDHYGWRIEVDSTPGKGTTFHIIFP
ncbi:MAG: two-component sensor histidine kinase [Proteobacteria bacterium SG_bin4]|nr:MAG: two-component sensor histidine kinase [Proteobacteria bacterium SG_bin4]